MAARFRPVTVARSKIGDEKRKRSILQRFPRVLRSDNGPEFVSRALLRWAANEGLDMALIDPGKPWQNGTAESFNGKFRDECLSMEWFRNRAEARVVIEHWRQHYNQVRPHSSLGNETPEAFRLKSRSGTQTEAILQE